MAAISQTRSPKIVAPLLSFIAGYVDTVGFVALCGLFTAHVTGNFVLIGAALVIANKGIIAKLAALPVFVLSVAATTVFVERCGRGGASPIVGVLIGQIIFLLAFCAVGFVASPVSNPDHPLAILAGLLGVCAMGIQNAASRLLMHDLPPTTVMTGSVTQFSIDVTRLLHRRGTAGEEERRRLTTIVTPVAAFAIGAIAAALIYSEISFLALLLPVLALIEVILLVRKSTEQTLP